MHKGFLATGAILAALSVALGAFGAHGLKKIAAEDIVGVFQTAVQYQAFHALALLAVGMVYEKFRSKWVKWSGILFIAGIILFSGSLYLLTALKISESSFISFIGPITPAGGLFFIAGWLSLFVGVMQKK
jgi:uncharacterized membrane protein YgdD (TMEM256/DUF423 family)